MANKQEKETARELYYELLEKKKRETDWNSLESVKAYNAYARELRHQLLDDE